MKPTPRPSIALASAPELRTMTDFTAVTVKRNSPMRLEFDLCEAIRKIANRCALDSCTVLSRIVRDALPYVTIDGNPLDEIGGE